MAKDPEEVEKIEEELRRLEEERWERKRLKKEKKRLKKEKKKLRKLWKLEEDEDEKRSQPKLSEDDQIKTPLADQFDWEGVVDETQNKVETEQKQPESPPMAD